MKSELETLSDYELLDKAYCELDKQLLLTAISRGSDLNMRDEDGGYLWESISFGFPSTSERPFYEDYSECRKHIEEKGVLSFLRIALDNGLNLNALGDDCGNPYAPIADMLDYCRSPELVSFLVKNGLDISLRISERFMLIDELDYTYWYCQFEDYEGRGIWLGWVISYLRRLGAESISSNLQSEGKNKSWFTPADSNVSVEIEVPDYNYKGR